MNSTKLISKESILKSFYEILQKKQDSNLVNFREIARKLNCHHTNLYNYYSSFQQLKEDAIIFVSNSIKSEIKPPNPSLNADSDLRQIIHALISFAINNPGIYKFLWVDKIEPVSAKKLREQVATPSNFIKNYILNFRKSDLSSDNAEVLGSILHSFIHGEIVKIICHRSKAISLKEIDLIVDRAMLICKLIF